jgi:4-hydroxy-3-polyprenylbenzoate decarboxylase
MAYSSLQSFIEFLEERKNLVRITHPVKADREITEITDRVTKAGGPALLFDNVIKLDGTPSEYPLLINAYGTAERMAWALGVDHVETIASELKELLHMQPPDGLWEKLKMLPKLAQFAKFPPKKVSSGACQELQQEEINLSALPVLNCWPEDGGPFITLPCVYTKHPDTGIRNVGTYRMQVFDQKTTGMHWQIHKGGSQHFLRYKELGKKIPVAVAIGGDPVMLYAATAPMPDNVDELVLAGFIRKKPVQLVPCKTIDMEVSADADFVIEGYVDPTEDLVSEGPFGDHTGYYSLADQYPQFHVTAITHRKKPIYHTTIVGPPLQEDGFIGQATERIFLPLLQMTFPEIVDMHIPIDTCFHNLAIVSIKKQYPGHTRKLMHSLWGMGQLMFSKMIVIVDPDVDVHNLQEVAWRAANNIDPRRDFMFTEGPLDALDHSADKFAFGSKVGIDATSKTTEEGHLREWPKPIKMDERTIKQIDSIWQQLGIV